MPLTLSPPRPRYARDDDDADLSVQISTDLGERLHQPELHRDQPE
jgi:hypothetical protein